MKEMIVSYLGDSSEYEITITDEPRMSCSCPAGQKYSLCKHRLALLEGDLSRCINLPAADAAALKDYLNSKAFGEIYSLLQELHVLEEKMASLKKDIGICKRKLGNRLH